MVVFCLIVPKTFERTVYMRKIYKIVNIALIFMVVGVLVYIEPAFGLRPPSLLNKAGREATIKTILSSFSNKQYPRSIEQFENDIKICRDYLENLIKIKNSSVDKEIVKMIMRDLVPICYQLGYPMKGSIIRCMCFQLLSSKQAECFKTNLDKKLNGIQPDIFINMIKEQVEEILKVRPNIKFKIHHRLKDIYSIYLKMVERRYSSLDEINDLFGIQLQVEVSEGKTEVDTLLDVASVFTDLPDDWVLINYRTYRDKIYDPLYPCIHIKYLVGDQKIPVEIQIWIDSYQFAYETFRYPVYKGYREKSSPSITSRLISIVNTLQKEGKVREYRELLLQLYHSDIREEDLTRNQQPNERNDEITVTPRASLLLDNGVMLPIASVSKIEKEENGFEITTIDNIIVERKHHSEKISLAPNIVFISNFKDTQILFLDKEITANPDRFKDALVELRIGEGNTPVVLLTQETEQVVKSKLSSIDLSGVIFKTLAELGLQDFDLDEVMSFTDNIDDLRCIPLTDSLCDTFRSLKEARDKV